MKDYYTVWKMLPGGTWKLAAEYLYQVPAEDHGRDLVRRGFEVRVTREERARA